MNAKRSKGAHAPAKSAAAYSAAERQEFDQEIGAAISHLHSLGKLPEDALGLFKSFEEVIAKKRASPNKDGWTQLQVWSAFKLSCLLGLREARRNPRSAPVDAMVTLGRWLNEASQQTTKRNFARAGGRRTKLQIDIVPACKDIREQFPNIIARRAHQMLCEGHKMANGRVIRFEKPMKLSTFQTRYWPKARV
jgi:hypothetical protein